ncbi:long-chain fatty acid transport protein 6-like [Acanthaster planci]|uniref:long-chain-fatty-acid--CoA ligase n=1 Tax=Acanthaster planci TaxID=133434 RepID=A0A8B7ZZ39_ACAPL|nr:long-chain fatty acid transport protein 6-like [Acanthaster planci]
MPLPIGSKVAGVTAVATLTGLPLATVAFLRLKYGPTVFQDLASIWQRRRFQKLLATLQQKNVKLVDFFEEHAKQTPEKVFILYQDELHTYGEVDKEANKLARFVKGTKAVMCLDTVGIFMMNEPSFIISWLAFNKLGLQIALLNYHLTGDALLHCIKACKVKAIVCGADQLLMDSIETILHELQVLGIRVWIIGDREKRLIPEGMIRVRTWNERSDPIPRSEREGMSNFDDAMYIFTSGTTGLPKPVKVPHYRQVRTSFIHQSFGLTKDDVMYTSLPLYHSAALNVGLVNVIRVGCTVALTNFSVRRFWDDVRRYRATVIQYIGEICRYLLAQPPRLDDGKYSHKIRYAIGNGLRPDIWVEFQKRFNIGHIAEFYGATDLPYFNVNMDGKVGSTGRYHGIFRALTDYFVIVECELETVQPIRGQDGKCILTSPGQPGLMLVRRDDIAMRFDGYLGDSSMTEKKLVRNVVKNGDLFINSGDLMVHDKDGYLYFKDRLGDTFRWKGENVATTEVAHMLNQYSGVQEANVYGVRVPGQDGRAGMAAVVFRKTHQLDPKAFYDHVVRSLPLYACPKFLRIMEEMEITGTFKHKKTDLAREGFDPNVISDPLFFMDEEKKTYAPLDKDAMQRIVIGKAKL